MTWLDQSFRQLCWQGLCHSNFEITKIMSCRVALLSKSENLGPFTCRQSDSKLLLMVIGILSSRDDIWMPDQHFKPVFMGIFRAMPSRMPFNHCVPSTEHRNYVHYSLNLPFAQGGQHGNMNPSNLQPHQNPCFPGMWMQQINLTPSYFMLTRGQHDFKTKRQVPNKQNSSVGHAVRASP